MLLKNKNHKKLIKTILLYFCFFCLEDISNLISFNGPLVSFLISPNNNLSYIFDCLNSILTFESVSFEINIINNKKNIDNNRIESYIKRYFKNVKNINIVNNNNTNNFFFDLNKAADSSKGKYLLFLGENVKVHKNWLHFLLEAIESDKTIGMVGSKIIYPDGVLEAAGGIVWNNGEYLYFGQGFDANLPEYNYVKEVDFISGVSMILKKSLWKKIGGFDGRFILNNYNDIDISFKIRKFGYKVIYQPKSIVEHYPEISYYINVLSNNNEYDKRQFIKKWKNELKYQFKKGNIFMARDRAINKSRIFAIDGSVPSFNQDAGSRCSFMYLNIFQEIGFQVTFLASNLIQTEPYTSVLQQKGIEVIYGKSFNENLEIWFKENLQYFKYIYLQRPDVTIKYIDIIKKYYSGKIIYFAHDLHHIRLFRQYKITQNENVYLQSQLMKKIETEIFSKVDVIYVVGNYEYEFLKQQYKHKVIRNIPLYIYENQYNNLEKDFSKRKDLIFVGGWHDTNVDAILWFSKEIFPKIIIKFPDIVWHIVTNQIDSAKKLDSKNIKIEGNLSDEDLHLLYQKCRLAIAPLRFGAGVKGKVIEAAYNQIPMVTTSIGAEGIDSKIGAFVFADNADKIAQIICELYIDFPKLKKMSDSGKILIEKYFSKEKAKDIILKDFKQ